MSQDTHTRLYELGYIITPTTTESDVAGVVSSLKQAIEALSGQVTTESTPEFIDLAYTMEKNI